MEIVKRTECPNCGGKVWDNTEDNKTREATNQKLRPDYSCRDKVCGWVQWRPKTKAKPEAKVMKASELEKAPLHTNCIKCQKNLNRLNQILDIAQEGIEDEL